MNVNEPNLAPSCEGYGPPGICYSGPAYSQWTHRLNKLLSDVSLLHDEVCLPLTPNHPDIYNLKDDQITRSIDQAIVDDAIGTLRKLRIILK